MVRTFLVAGLLVIAMAGCKKGSDDAATPVADPVPETPTEETIGTVPTSFTQKVLLEIFTGAGQSQCPDGFVKESGITANYSSQAIPVRIHFSDAMEIGYYTTMESTFNNGMPPSFPSAMINRTPSLGIMMLNRTQWLNNFNTARSKIAVCGLSIKSTLSGTTANVEVHAGFKQVLSGTYNLTVLMIENNVTGSGSQYDQRNSYNITSGHPYFGAGDPILNFNHQHTLRKVLSANLGDLITSTSIVAGGEFVKTYSANVNSYKPEDIQIIAFIEKTGSSATTHEIMNVQKVSLGGTKNWD